MVSSYDIAVRAKKIFDSASSEVEYRCSARCAYYSLYHYCESMDSPLLASPNTSGGVHYQLISKFVGSKDQEMRKIGEMLNQGRIIRVQADYRLEKNFRKDDARKVLRFAEKVVIKAFSEQKEV